MPVYQPINALLRGLEVLKVVNRLRVATVGDVHRETGYPKSSIVRILETLIEAGYVSTSPDGRGYVATARTLQLATSTGIHAELLEVALPLLREFQREVVWPSDFACFDTDAMVILETSRQPGTLSVNRMVGDRLPVLQTALGRAYLAFCQPAEHEAVIARLRTSTSPEDRLARNPAALEAELVKVRKLGYAINDGHTLPQIRAIAMPILCEGYAVASFNVISIAKAMTIDEVVDHFGPPMRRTAQAISTALEKRKSSKRLPQHSQRGYPRHGL